MNRRRPLRTIYTDKVNDIKKILLAVRSDPMSYVPNPTKYNPCVMSTEGCKYDPYEPSMCVMPFMFHASLTRTASACRVSYAYSFPLLPSSRLTCFALGATWHG